MRYGHMLPCVTAAPVGLGIALAGREAPFARFYFNLLRMDAGIVDARDALARLLDLYLSGK